MLPTVQLENKGLYTYPNQLSQVPPGAMTIARNGVVDRTGIFETRRGFDFYGVPLPSSYAIKGFVYNSTLLFYLFDGSLVSDGGGGASWPTYAGTFFPPLGNFIQSTQANGNFYFTTNNGVYKLDSVAGIPRPAGAPPSLDISAAITGLGNAVINNSQVAYSVVIGYIDVNDNLILGSPSMWFVLTNTSGTTQNVDVDISLPAGLTTQYFVQLYRTPNTGSATITPGNNFQLAMEYQLTAPDIAAGSVTISDMVPDSLLGAFLYTDDGQPNNLPNDQPPLAQDIATFNGMTFYSAFSTRQTLDITLDSVGAPNGIQIGDTISITDVDTVTTRTYTGAAANNFAAQQFKVDTAGTIAQNIDNTARNLVRAMNRDTGNTFFYAYYVTTLTSLPGQIVLQARDLQNGPFYANSSRQTCWTPEIPVTGPTYISSNNSLPGSMLVSKVNQPEAVPLAQQVTIQTGEINIVIFRIVPLQDALYAFTTGGIFRVTGTSPSTLQVLLFDSSAILVGLQTPQILNNSIYYFSTQAICSVSSGGNQIISRNIERDLLRLSVLPNFTSISYGVVYESERKYLLYCSDDPAATSATQTYVYNWITQAFTLWDRPCSAGIVNPVTQTLFVADTDGNIFQERKDFTTTDYSDQMYTVTIVSTNTTLNTITLVSSADVVVGDIIQQTVGLVQYSTQVTDNDTGTNTLTVDDATGFAPGSAQDYRSIVTEVQYCPITCGFPEYMKKAVSYQFYFENATFEECPVAMTTDIYTIQEIVPLRPIMSGGWGTFPWGTLPWGVGASLQQLIPTWPTQNTCIGHWFVLNLTLTQAFNALALNGVSLTFDIISTRGR